MPSYDGYPCPAVPEHGPLVYIESINAYHCPHVAHIKVTPGTRMMFTQKEAQEGMVAK